MGTASQPANVPSAAANQGNTLPSHKLLALYHTMVMARAVERRVWVLNRLSETAVTLGAGGAEALQVAASAALQPGTDWVVPHPRDLTLCLAMGLTPLDLMLAVFGRASDPGSGGRQAPGSFGLRRARVVTTSVLAGTQVVHAAGIAYASKQQGLDEVTLVSVGLRATDTGDWHEGLNFAAVHGLPLVCLVQDSSADHTSASPGLPGQHAADLIARRARGYGMAGDSVDGTDFAEALTALGRAVERARSGEGPTLVHARVAGLTSLTSRGTRQPPEQLEALARQDPIERMRRDLHETLVLDDATEDQIQRDCILVVEAAVQQARSSPSPEAARALDNVFEGAR